MDSQRNDEVDDIPADRFRSVARSSLPALFTVLLLTSSLVGAAAITDVSTNFMDVAKIVSVVAFIGAMVALALGMIGDAYRS